jgi:CBS domain containing-hemolysin-like protein
VQGLLESLPWLITMAVLIGCSAFFSASEAALFYLRRADRRVLAKGTLAQRAAERLLHDPERLLSAVLFWNLVTNITYFAIATIVGLRLERHPSGGQTSGVAFAMAALLTIIFFSEMVPKSIAVLRARSLAGIVGVPLATFVRLVDPIMPWLRWVSEVSRRLFLPGLVPEQYLERGDLERAIELSHDTDLMDQERTVLRNVVALSDIRVEEWMSPRRQLMTFRPPVSLHDLEGDVPSTGYLLITSENDDDIVGSVHLPSLSDFDTNHLEFEATNVVYVPWCSAVSDAWQELLHAGCDVAVVVNELGETIGVLTREHILDAVLSVRPERGQRLLNRATLREVSDGVWEVEGVTNLRLLSREFGVPLPSSRHVTVSGIIQETLERLPVIGDECEWGPFRFVVLRANDDQTLLRMTVLNREDQS